MALLRTKRLAMGEVVSDTVVYVCPPGMRAVIRTATIILIYAPVEPAPTNFYAEIDVETSTGNASAAWYEWLRDNQYTSQFNGQIVLHALDSIRLYVGEMGGGRPPAYFYISGAELPEP